MGKVKYLLLDCDNTLCQSERLAFEACTELTNEVLAKYNVDHRYTVEGLLEDYVGYNFRKMLEAMQPRLNFKMTQEDVDHYVDMELGRVTEKLLEKCVECPGAYKELDKLRAQGYPMAVVSTSAKTRVVASLKKTGLLDFFEDEHVYSAATSLNPPSSKPDPAIYLHACKELGVKPEECVAVEDSRSGGTAAMRAGIPIIGYVGIYNLEEGEEKMHKMAKMLKDDCNSKVTMYDWKEFPECLKKIEEMM